MSNRIDFDYNELYNFYVVENHSFEETQNYFNTTKDILLRNIKQQNLQKKRFRTERVMPMHDELYNLYIKENKSVKELCEIYDVPIYTMEFWLRYRKIQKPKKLVTKIIKKTLLERYGDEKYNNREKSLQTNLERYGSNHYNQTQEFKDFIKQRRKSRTSEEIENYSKICKERFLKLYGVTSPACLPEVQQKISYALKNRSEDEKQKTKEYQIKNSLEKYGYESWNQSPEVIQKKMKTFAKNYKNGHNSREHFTNYENFNKKYVLNNFVENGYFLIHDFGKYFNFSYSASFRHKEKLGIFIPNKANRYKSQADLYNAINIENKMFNKRGIIKDKELDIFLSDYNLAIEYDGLMWHSFGISTFEPHDNLDKEDINHLLYKTELCKKLNINLLHFYDTDDAELTKSYINNLLGLNETLDFNECEIREINKETFEDFYLQNSLNDLESFTKYFGLFKDNKLVQILGLNEKTNFICVETLKNYFINYNIINYLKLKNIKVKFNRRFGEPFEFFKSGFQIEKTLKPSKLYFNKKEYKLRKFKKSVDSKDFFENHRIFYDCGYYILGLAK